MWFKLISTRVFFDIFEFFFFRLFRSILTLFSWLQFAKFTFSTCVPMRHFDSQFNFFSVRSFRFRFVAVRWVRANIEITYKPCCKWYYFVVGYVSWGCRYFSLDRFGCRWLTRLTWLLPRFDQPPHNTALITSASFLHIIIVMIIIIMISQCCCCIPV